MRLADEQESEAGMTQEEGGGEMLRNRRAQIGHLDNLEH